MGDESHTSIFPSLNAALNASSAVLLLLGWAAIRWKQVGLHKACMLSALSVSTVFLGCYLWYHFAIRHGVPKGFPGPSDIKPVYLAILWSHIVLAIVTAPLALWITYLGLRDRLATHRRVARWTLPLWLYVSVTGVVVYWMLYVLYPSP